MQKTALTTQVQNVFSTQLPWAPEWLPECFIGRKMMSMCDLWCFKQFGLLLWWWPYVDLYLFQAATL